MTITTSRRAILAGAAAVITLPAKAEPIGAEAEFRRLWAQYQRHATICNAAWERYKPRPAYEAALPPCPRRAGRA